MTASRAPHDDVRGLRRAWPENPKPAEDRPRGGGFEDRPRTGHRHTWIWWLVIAAVILILFFVFI
ncbi:hypothetical protein AQJ66_12610 [Streptomyces bungoensis]|uniref:Uncharacterized protein n=1 Tax=Streptomyces bungoensis TaxID=285568 RepID=A0A101T4Q0_9ACTN|nr:hypothetical protein AQJ66_12610 [Streptomyces bungoensis]